MSLGFSPDDFGLAIVAMLALLLLLPIAMGSIGLLARMLGSIIGIAAGWLMLGILTLFFGGLLIGGSLYMDVAAQSITGIVTKKTESMEIQRAGDWRHQFAATVEYPLAGKISSVTLEMNADHFDELLEGEVATLSVASVYGTAAIVRLAAITSAEWLAKPLRWLGIGAFGLLLFWLATQLKSRLGCGALAIVGLLAVVAIPTAMVYRTWQAAEDLASRPLRAEATVIDVQRITNIDYFTCQDDCGDLPTTAFDVQQQYDIVQMRFVPENRRAPVLAVDSADVGSIQIEIGQTITVAYAANAARAAQIIGATHSHHWRNAIFFVGNYAATLLVFYTLWFAFEWLVAKIRRRVAISI